jgi:hypothetical protein
MSMNSLQDAVQAILSQPTPSALVKVQGALLALGQQEGVDRALDVTGHLHEYLSELQVKISAREYSELASRLDIGAVGIVALENLVTSEGESFWQRFFFGGLAKVLMVFAGRQYVKGWTATDCPYPPLVPTEALARWPIWRSPADGAGRRSGALAPAYAADVPAGRALLLGQVYQSTPDASAPLLSAA